MQIMKRSTRVRILYTRPNNEIMTDRLGNRPLGLCIPIGTQQVGGVKPTVQWKLRGDDGR